MRVVDATYKADLRKLPEPPETWDLYRVATVLGISAPDARWRIKGWLLKDWIELAGKCGLSGRRPLYRKKGE